MAVESVAVVVLLVVSVVSVVSVELLGGRAVENVPPPVVVVVSPDPPLPTPGGAYSCSSPPG